jgi:hypothetical protein
VFPLDRVTFRSCAGVLHLSASETLALTHLMLQEGDTDTPPASEAEVKAWKSYCATHRKVVSASVERVGVCGNIQEEIANIVKLRRKNKPLGHLKRKDLESASAFYVRLDLLEAKLEFAIRDTVDALAKAFGRSLSFETLIPSKKKSGRVIDLRHWSAAQLEVLHSSLRLLMDRTIDDRISEDSMWKIRDWLCHSELFRTTQFNATLGDTASIFVMDTMRMYCPYWHLDGSYGHLASEVVCEVLLKSEHVQNNCHFMQTIPAMPAKNTHAALSSGPHVSVPRTLLAAMASIAGPEDYAAFHEDSCAAFGAPVKRRMCMRSLDVLERQGVYSGRFDAFYNDVWIMLDNCFSTNVTEEHASHLGTVGLAMEEAFEREITAAIAGGMAWKDDWSRRGVRALPPGIQGQIVKAMSTPLSPDTQDAMARAALRLGVLSKDDDGENTLCLDALVTPLQVVTIFSLLFPKKDPEYRILSDDDDDEME